MTRLIYYASMPNLHLHSKHHRKMGRGMGSVLLGGVGSASSYPSVDDYEETTGRQVGKGIFPSGKGIYPSGKGLSLFSAGGGIGLGMDKSGLNKKLESLNVAPKKEKAKNIRFNL